MGVKSPPIFGSTPRKPPCLPSPPGDLGGSKCSKQRRSEGTFGIQCLDLADEKKNRGGKRGIHLPLPDNTLYIGLPGRGRCSKHRELEDEGLTNIQFPMTDPWDESGIFTDPWMVDVYGKCKQLYWYHTWILWGMVKRRSFINKIRLVRKMSKHWTKFSWGEWKRWYVRVWFGGWRNVSFKVFWHLGLLGEKIGHFFGCFLEGGVYPVYLLNVSLKFGVFLEVFVKYMLLNSMNSSCFFQWIVSWHHPQWFCFTSWS